MMSLPRHHSLNTSLVSSFHPPMLSSLPLKSARPSALFHDLVNTMGVVWPHSAGLPAHLPCKHPSPYLNLCHPPLFADRQGILPSQTAHSGPGWFNSACSPSLSPRIPLPHLVLPSLLADLQDLLPSRPAHGRPGGQFVAEGQSERPTPAAALLLIAEVPGHC